MVHFHARELDGFHKVCWCPIPSRHIHHLCSPWFSVILLVADDYGLRLKEGRKCCKGKHVRVGELGHRFCVEPRLPPPDSRHPHHLTYLQKYTDSIWPPFIPGKNMESLFNFARWKIVSSSRRYGHTFNSSMERSKKTFHVNSVSYKLWQK